MANSERGKVLLGIRHIIEYLGGSLDDPHLKETPQRYLAFLEEMMAAQHDAKLELDKGTFETKTKDLVIVSPIPFASMCAHHLLPYTGTASVGYIPKGRVVGLSKLVRIVRVVSAGLTIQEELADRIGKEVKRLSRSANVAVTTNAVHSCMVVRGVKSVGTEATCAAMFGAFRENVSLRNEFYQLVKGGS